MAKTTNDFMGDLQKLIDLGEIKTIDDVSINTKRRIEYLKAGVNPSEMLVALWELVVEKRPEAADALQIKRLEVKAKIIT